MDRTQLVIIWSFLAAFMGRSQAGFEVNKGTFWQITDIHLDPFYSETGDVRNECHGNVSTGNIGRYGNFSCDAPWALVKDAIRAIKAIDPKPDFILWTGDSTAHVRTVELKWDKVYANLENITMLLLDAFPRSLIIPIIGNHDSYPANDFPYDNVKTMYQGYLSKAQWSLLIPPEATRTFHQGGYYSRYINPKLKVLVLNTNLYLTYNTNRTKDDDPTGQLAWLEGELKIAKDNNIYVIIAAHVPPGYFERLAIIPFMDDKYNDAYVNLLLNYSSIIFTQIYGHTHTDSFRLMSSASSGAVPVTHAFIAPSVSPWKVPMTGTNGVNPSVRLYKYNIEKKMMLDYEQYYLNLTKANEANYSKPSATSEDTIDERKTNSTRVLFEADETNATQEPFDYPERKTIAVDSVDSAVNWELLYRATDLYGVSNLSLASLRDIYRDIVNEEDVFDRYYEMNTVGVGSQICNHDCYKTHVCAMRYVTTPTIRQCMSPHSNVSSADAEVISSNVVTDTSPRTIAANTPTDMPTGAVSDATEDSKKHHHHHGVSPYMPHVIMGIAIGLLISLIVVGALAIRRWRFRSYYRYKRHFSIQS